MIDTGKQLRLSTTFEDVVSSGLKALRNRFSGFLCLANEAVFELHPLFVWNGMEVVVVCLKTFSLRAQALINLTDELQPKEFGATTKKKY